MKHYYTKIATFIFATLAIFSSNAQCDVSISATDTLVCSGDEVTITTDIPGVPNSMNATYVAGNNHRGNMFNIVATNTVVIDSFDVHPMGNTTVEVYYRPESYVGFESSSAGWIFLGSVAVTAQPMGTPTPLDVPVNVTIPAGQTHSFYVTSNSTSVSLNYSNGTTVGNVYSSDANIQFIEGVGMEYPFTAGSGAIYSPRIWNGTIHYTVPTPTTYTWNTTETSQSITPTILTNSQYSVSVDVSGCPTQVLDIDIAVSEPIVSAGPDLAICLGDTANLAATGATSYTWDNGIVDALDFVPATTMDYIVSGIDSIGCTGADTMTLTVHDLPVVSAGPDLAACSNSSVTLNGSGAAAYSWTNGVTDGVPFMPVVGDYIVTGTDINGCINSDTMTLTTVSVNTTTAVVGVTIIAPFDASYQWIDCSDNSLIAGATNQIYTADANGSYAVIITESGCTDTSACEIIASVGINEWDASENISIAPNPTANDVHIHTGEERAQRITLLNAAGQVLIHIVPESSESTISLRDYPSGVYFISVSLDRGTVMRKVVRM